MIEPLTPVVELYSRLGRVGSIQAWNPWESRKSVSHAKWWVSKIASLSYGNDAAKNPEALFQSIVERGHLSCLEFVPVRGKVEFPALPPHLPAASLRNNAWMLADNSPYSEHWAWEIQHLNAIAEPATAFLVECPLYTRSQWMRHRSFSYLEMSRRYTKGSKVEWGYYGVDASAIDEDVHDKTDVVSVDLFHAACEAEYQRRLDAGWPNEIARGCMPMEAMTRFWVAGFNRDWEALLKLRDDAHAQPEIRVFAQWIRNHLHPESVSMDAGNLGT